MLKNLRKMNELMSVAAAILLGFGALSCHRNSPAASATVDLGDDKAAAAGIAQADQLYAQRADLAKARSAVSLLRQARTADYGNFEAAWKLARANYYVGSHSSGDESDNAFREGIEAGKTAVQLQGNKPEGHLWLGANYGGSAENSTLAGLSSVQDIRQEMDAVIKIDETFQNGSAYLGLGQLYLRAPKVLGGDTAKAIEYLQKGLRIGPTNELIKVNLAEAYHQAGRDAEAKKQLDELFAMTPNPDYLPEHNDAIQKAKKLQGQLK
jgi:tetratricopeptide (TPR) repeat protein